MGRGVGTYVPGSSIESIKKAICKATSPNEAAEILCEDSTTKEKHVQDPVTYDPIESLVEDFGSNKDNDKSYTLCIDREELWRGALGFYKKALSDKTSVLKDLIIVFKGEEGLDYGAMRVEYFELLLTEIHQFHDLKDHNQSITRFLSAIALKVFYLNWLELLLAILFCKADQPFHCFLQLFITNW